MHEKHKKCFRCQDLKPLDSFYRHSAMRDGRLNKCIECTKEDVIKRYNSKRKDVEWAKSERTRGRLKYHRLGYREKQVNVGPARKAILDRYGARFPEKISALKAVSKMKREKVGAQFHHWSYNKEHQKDVIELSPKDHKKAHRFLIYDQERMMYRNIRGVLLDTKDSHLAYIIDKINNEPN